MESVMQEMNGRPPDSVEILAQHLHGKFIRFLTQFRSLLACLHPFCFLSFFLPFIFITTVFFSLFRFFFARPTVGWSGRGGFLFVVAVVVVVDVVVVVVFPFSRF